MSAIPPSVLLAPTIAQDPTKPMDVPEPTVKNAEVQTAYRESEAQTVPYTPDYFVPEGEDPEVLMLMNLTFDHGLPLNKKDLEMVGHAKAKREMESNLPPFTDEASMLLRKRLMEAQEMKEFKLRESEIDRRREERLVQLQQALTERDESNELLASQRVEAMRQTRMEEREVALQKIRNKRVKVLRRLARKRNSADPMLSEGAGRDIVNDYFDKASTMYAPIKRVGKLADPDPSKFDVASRTAPLDNMNNIMNFEMAVPMSLLQTSDERSFSPTKNMSKSAPLGTQNRIRAAEERLTSAANRSLRNTKRDIEEMHQILLKKKRAAQALITPSTPNRPRGLTSAGSSPEKSSSASGSRKKGVRGRPRTPDLTVNEEGASTVELDNQPLRAACILLQRLIRGRAVQNVMYEGRIRRTELIKELRSADEALARERAKSVAEISEETKALREQRVKTSTVDSIIGSATSNLLHILSTEQERKDYFDVMQGMANAAIEERRMREAAEGGRRQRENLALPAN